MPQSETSGRLFFLFAVLAAMLTYPILSIADQPDLLWGAPRLLVFFFALWIVVIAATYAAIRSAKKPRA